MLINTHILCELKSMIIQETIVIEINACDLVMKVINRVSKVHAEHFRLSMSKILKHSLGLNKIDVEKFKNKNSYELKQK